VSKDPAPRNLNLDLGARTTISGAYIKSRNVQNTVVSKFSKLNGTSIIF